MHRKSTIPKRLNSYKQEDRGYITPCWIWQGCIDASNGYGKCSSGTGDSPAFSHRWMYSYFKGDIPDGMVIDHLCRVKECCNPEHLEAVTQRENIRRGFISRGLTINPRAKVKTYDHENLLPSERMVIDLREQGMKYKDISRITGKSVAALTSLHARANKKKIDRL